MSLGSEGFGNQYRKRDVNSGDYSGDKIHIDYCEHASSDALPVPTERCSKPRAWSFKAGSHKTRIIMRLPGALVDAPDAVVLFQEAPGAPALVEVAPRTT